MQVSVLLSCLVLSGALARPAFAAGENPPAISEESTEQHDARMAWWRDARFGMFVHWGLYAIPAGEWNGRAVPGIGEWIMNKGQIPLSDYQPLAKKFNPQSYDPDRWAQLAADAGMKYLVITSKHHDGFCLFDTAATEWDVVDATPYGKDLLKPLAEACRKRGVRFCTYYSILDWSHPSQQVDPDRPHDTVMDPARKAEYVAYMKQQLSELIASSDPDVLWFDGEWVPWWTESDGRDLYAYLLELKPTLIVNNRVGKGRKGMEGLNRGDQQYAGDFGTPEQQIPATGVPGVDWESCMTMNDTWGFKKNDHNWKSAQTLTRDLIDIVSKGGNFLLNVGPTATGEIPQPSVERLAAMGEWIDQHGEAVYGRSASPTARPEWGRCTLKAAPASSTGTASLYLFVFHPPADGVLELAGVTGEIADCRLLGGEQPLKATATSTGVRVELLKQPLDPISGVIRVTFAAPPRVQSDAP